jgi:hypothetical protein
MTSKITNFFSKTTKTNSPTTKPSKSSSGRSSLSDQLLSCFRKSKSVNDETIEDASSLPSGLSSSCHTSGQFTTHVLENDPDPAKNLKPLYHGQEPCQVHIDFPQTEGRRFNANYYREFGWLEYSISTDAAFCFNCRMFPSDLQNKNKDAFTTGGFKNWKNAKSRFNKHQSSHTHQDSTVRLNGRLNATKTVVAQVHKQHENEVICNRNYLCFLINCILYLARQGLALRGHDESDTSNNRGNFIELVNLIVLQLDFAPELKPFLSKDSVCNYLGPKTQNEIISILADRIRKKILADITEEYSIIVDETMDLSKEEQVSFCIQ